MNELINFVKTENVGAFRDAVKAELNRRLEQAYHDLTADAIEGMGMKYHPTQVAEELETIEETVIDLDEAKDMKPEVEPSPEPSEKEKEEDEKDELDEGKKVCKEDDDCEDEESDDEKSDDEDSDDEKSDDEDDSEDDDSDDDEDSEKEDDKESDDDDDEDEDEDKKVLKEKK